MIFSKPMPSVLPTNDNVKLRFPCEKKKRKLIPNLPTFMELKILKNV